MRGGIEYVTETLGKMGQKLTRGFLFFGVIPYLVSKHTEISSRMTFRYSFFFLLQAPSSLVIFSKEWLVGSLVMGGN